MNHAIRSPVPDLPDCCAEVFGQVAIHHVDFTRLCQQCDKPRDTVDNRPRLGFTPLRCVRSRCKLTCSLGDEKASLLEPEDRLVRGDIQKERLGLLRKVELLRTGNYDAELPLDSQKR